MLPEDWRIRAISAIANVKTGPFGSALHERDYVDDETPIVTVEHLSEHGIRHQNLPLVSNRDRRRLKGYLLRRGDIVFSRVGSVDRNSLVSQEEDGWLFSGRLLRVRISSEDLTSARYLSYHLYTESFKKRVHSLAVGQTMASLNTGILRAVQVVLPHVLEQRAIAAALSDVDELVESLAALIAKKRVIKQAAMQELLTGRTRLPGFGGEWETRRLGELGTFTKGRGIARGDLRATGVRCVRYGELYTQYENYVAKPKSRIPPEAADAALPIKKGDLLFAGSGETAEEIGVCLAYIGEEPAYAGGDIIVLRASGQDAVYLAHLLNAPVTVRQKARMAQGDAIVHIRADHLAEVELALPPLPEQRGIANVLSDMDAEITALEHRLDKTRAIKQGMMQQLLTGSIRLPIPEDETRDDDHDA
ncbi:MAG: restriction endonuclease subunit S [bacterium]|nr:restriction endonuclease subunit S [bacterium]